MSISYKLPFTYEICKDTFKMLLSHNVMRKIKNSCWSWFINDRTIGLFQLKGSELVRNNLVLIRARIWSWISNELHGCSSLLGWFCNNYNWCACNKHLPAQLCIHKFSKLTVPTPWSLLQRISSGSPRTWFFFAGTLTLLYGNHIFSCWRSASLLHFQSRTVLN